VCDHRHIQRWVEIQRRRDEFGLSYFVFGAEVSDALAAVAAKLAGT
jgi:hypothetical protein